MRNIVLSILSILVLLIYPLSLSAQSSFSLSLDVDSAAGNQAVTSLNVSADQVVAIQIFGTGIQNANGLAARFEYDARQVVYEGFDVGDVLPNAQALPERGTGFVEIGIASLGGRATADGGLVGTVRFRATAAFSGTAIRLVRAELSRSGQFETVTLNTSVELQLQVLTSDFNGDGVVNFADFLAFAGQFGTRQGDGRYEAQYDLDSDGAIGFGDFLIFSSSFGKEAGSGGSTTTVTIPDASLRAAIEAALGKASGALITRTEMASLTRLEAPASEIRDLIGLEFATGLTSLILSDNSISDLTPLSGLTNLTLLILSGNLFSDISPLSGLTNLTSLNLSHNSISDISPLSGLTNLAVLILYDDTMIRDRSVLSRLSNLSKADIPDANLRMAIKITMGKASDDPVTNFEMAFLSELEAPNSNIRDLTGLEFATSLTNLDLGTEQVSGEGYVNSNHISDFSLLSGMTNLRRLDLGGNSISDLSALSGAISRLPSLERLYLDTNSISDITPLSGLIRLERLYLDTNSVSDLSPLSGLTDLVWLDLDNNSISDVSPLSGLTNLAGLDLDTNSISDLSPLSGLTNLLSLGLRTNSISDVSTLSGLTNLLSLDLRTNSISDVSTLSGLTRLARLYLSINSISDLSPLSGLTNLLSLFLSTNSISDVSALSGLTRLELLYLDTNSISDLSSLSGLTNLERLGLSSNSISDVSALSGLTNLERLYLDTNNISDISPLVANTGLGTGDEIDVRNNPLSTISLNTHIPALQDRRIEVRFGALKPAVEKIEIPDEMMELLGIDERRK